MTNLVYSRNVGCAAGVYHGGSPRQCENREAMAVPHLYRYPRPRIVRLYVCTVHAREHPTAEPLTEQDRQVIAARRARRDEQLARAGRQVEMTTTTPGAPSPPFPDANPFAEAAPPPPPPP